MLPISALSHKRRQIQEAYLLDEDAAIKALSAAAAMAQADMAVVSETAAEMVQRIRQVTKPGLMENFFAQYSLSTDEGLGLMCLAEAFSRIPDAATMDDLVRDKITKGNWRQKKSGNSPLMMGAGIGLSLTKAILKGTNKETATGFAALVERTSLPAIRAGIKVFMKYLGRQFVLGQTIERAQARATQNKAFRYSYDMLGEAAKTATDADAFYHSYQHAIKSIAASIEGASGGLMDHPGISIKLSALHPRYEWTQRPRILAELAPRVLALAKQAKAAGIGLTIDAEEANRLELSLDVIETVLASADLVGWDGFGVVVQAYGKRAPFVLDYLYELAEKLNRKITIRLVKGAYWDAEIKQAQVLGLSGYPVFTQKAHTDISYAACAKKLAGMTDRVFPQFATHNVQTIATILHLFKGRDRTSFEFQRLHGMGESAYRVLMQQENVACRVYAPVGAHRDLLAYLVRRLLENGANSSFVNKLYDESLAPALLAADPQTVAVKGPTRIGLPGQIFGMKRKNALGWDMTDLKQMENLILAMTQYKGYQWHAAPMLGVEADTTRAAAIPVVNPADSSDIVGSVIYATTKDVTHAFGAAAEAFSGWHGTPVAARATILLKAADLFEEATPELFTLLGREAGKTMPDAIAEVREAVDFLRYYALQAQDMPVGHKARGTIVCISPWNFPLAIFTGQIAVALAVGNCVLAKPAEQTPLIAAVAVRLLQQAGVPAAALQLLFGEGKTIGQALVTHPSVSGVCFTGSTATAQHINKALAVSVPQPVPLIAETGGLNAMIVDSSALPEQAVRDIVASAFQSAGQRCSALRLLYVQEDVKERLLDMLFGAMDELRLGDPLDLSVDIGPVIDRAAHANIQAYIKEQQAAGRVLKSLPLPNQLPKGWFVPPTVVSVAGIADLPREIFGPVLHIAAYKAADLPAVVQDINDRGFGLTLGMHSRIEQRTEALCAAAHVGNIYINRNQIGAVVGSQPFGGEGLSGTGPKAGGPQYLHAFVSSEAEKWPETCASSAGTSVAQQDVEAALAQIAAAPAIAAPQLVPALAAAFLGAAPELFALAEQFAGSMPLEHSMPGPVGESNNLRQAPKGTVVCLGPDARSYALQLMQALYFGNKALLVTADTDLLQRLRALSLTGVSFLEGMVSPAVWQRVVGIDGVAYAGGGETAKQIQSALADRAGAILPLINEPVMPYRYVKERHICTDTTAAGGNVTLLAGG